MIEQEGARHTYPQQLATAEAEWANRALATWIGQPASTRPRTESIVDDEHVPVSRIRNW